jgi:hypothetical protein
MIKGKYVAKIEIDILVDENTPGLLPFDQLKNVVHNETTAAVKSVLDDEFSAVGTVTVSQQFADLWMEAAHE